MELLPDLKYRGLSDIEFAECIRQHVDDLNKLLTDAQFAGLAFKIETPENQNYRLTGPTVEPQLWSRGYVEISINRPL